MGFNDDNFTDDDDSTKLTTITNIKYSTTSLYQQYFTLKA